MGHARHANVPVLVAKGRADLACRQYARTEHACKIKLDTRIGLCEAVNPSNRKGHMATPPPFAPPYVVGFRDACFGFGRCAPFCVDLAWASIPAFSRGCG